MAGIKVHPPGFLKDEGGASEQVVIEVEGLSKFYADIPAVRDLSFTVKKGEIVGFLGPNGAGKSTTMRILTGFLPPSGGRARIAGFDIETHSREARRHLGYLPESVPLYPEMRVSEYLSFRARLKGIASFREEIERVCARAFLSDKKEQIIGTLSKGYRQRVGLADALLGRPPILILDEPTEGLDPAQIKATRELIRSLAEEHTVLLSTHILPEVDQICQRVLLIHRGRLAADLRREGEGADSVGWVFAEGPETSWEKSLLLSFEAPPQDLPKTLQKLPGVKKILELGGSRYELLCTQEEDPRDALIALAAQKQLKLREMRPKSRSIEDIFISLTSKEPQADD